MFGSGDGPMVYSVFKKRKVLFVTSVRPSRPIPAKDSVAQIGSPENSSSYSGVRKKRTIRSFMTKWSISSCASCSVILPSSISRWIYTSKKVETRPNDIAAPFCDLTAAK